MQRMWFAAAVCTLRMSVEAGLIQGLVGEAHLMEMVGAVG